MGLVICTCGPAARLLAVVSLIAFTAAGATSCRSAGASGSPQIIQPGAPGQASRTISAATAADLSPVKATAADVAFMQGMIGHHTQAVEMVELLKTRTSRDDMRMLGLRIEVSQSDEMKMMQHWLEARGQPVAGPHAHHGGDAAAMPGMAMGDALMPGMLTADEMARLTQARGPAFDRLFLEGMIKHHEGALTMVRTLFATKGAGQDAEIFAFASDVDSDQRMEIDRMRGMLTVQ